MFESAELGFVLSTDKLSAADFLFPIEPEQSDVKRSIVN
jgi:hypothetical protein